MLGKRRNKGVLIHYAAARDVDQDAVWTQRVKFGTSDSKS